MTKFVHMDESGISHGEPFCTQVGVVVTADKQWKQVERRLAEVLAELVPYKHSKDYCFHAKDIFQGTDKYYTRERFPDPQMRAAVVRQVAAITTEFKLPVVIGFLEKENFPRILKWKSRKTIATHFHSLAYHVCAYSIEKWMRENTPEDEVAMLFVENNNQSRDLISVVHKVNSISGLVGELPVFRNVAQFQRIVEMPNFVEKQDSSLLQIADACAFSFNRVMRGLSQGEFLYEGFREQVYAHEYRPQ